MNKDHLFRFGRLEFMDTYAVITCNESANIDMTEIREIQSVLYPVYIGKKFGLIANRENRYSVNPIAIKKLFSYEHLVAGAIVGHTDIAKKNAKIEDFIVDGAPIRFFEDMPPAIGWIEVMVKESCDG